jgi:hypothetical protein
MRAALTRLPGDTAGISPQEVPWAARGHSCSSVDLCAEAFLSRGSPRARQMHFGQLTLISLATDTSGTAR